MSRSRFHKSGKPKPCYLLTMRTEAQCRLKAAEMVVRSQGYPMGPERDNYAGLAISWNRIADTTGREAIAIAIRIGGLR